MKHLLVVDDDTKLRDLTKKFLVKSGYLVATAENASSAEHLMQSVDFDLILLDVMMPGEDGISFAARLRDSNQIPIIMLTAKSEVTDRIEGLGAGVDDFISKPFDPRELILRIEAVLRRVQPHEQSVPSHFRFGEFVFDTNDRRLMRGDERVDITRGESDLLFELVKSNGETVRRYDLLPLFGDGDGSARAVDVLVTRLRKKIENDPKQPLYIQTVRGEGYRINTGA